MVVMPMRATILTLCLAATACTTQQPDCPAECRVDVLLPAWETRTPIPMLHAWRCDCVAAHADAGSTPTPSPQPAREVVVVPPAAASLADSAPVVLVLPTIVVTADKPKARHAPPREEPEADDVRVFCEQWPSGVICDSYRY